MDRHFSKHEEKMLLLLTVYLPQFYSARAGGDTAGLGIDGFHLQRAMFC